MAITALTICIAYLDFPIFHINAFIPEGMSTLAMGTVVFFSVDKMAPNGSRTAPWKLKPKMASTTRL